jgi:hypothetical protein
MKTFKEAWADKESEGYQYGRDALEGVHFGFDIALKMVAERLREKAKTHAKGAELIAIADAIERGDL